MKAAKEMTASPAGKPRLERDYLTIYTKMLMSECGYKNVMQIPKLEKIVVNMTTKECVTDGKVANRLYDDLFTITGQKPVFTRAKEAIAAFNLRKGATIGAKVTLRGAIMYEFLDRLVNIALPRTRDFKGFRKTQFDGHGNFAFGLKEQIVFPEINYDQIDKIRGMDIVITTSAKTDKEAQILLEKFAIPFR